MKSQKIFSTIFGTLLLSASTFAFAAGTASECPDGMITSMDGEFGAGTSDITTCITNHQAIKVVVNVSSDLVNGKKHVLQQINNALNIAQGYAKYGIGDTANGLQINVVMHGKAGKFGLSEEAFTTKYPNDDPQIIQKTLSYIATLKNDFGAHIYMCQNTMRANGFKTTDLGPDMEEVPSGVVAVTDFGTSGYVVLTP